MSNAIVFHEAGGPEVMQLTQVAVGDPAAGQARVRHSAIGVNFIDVYQRSGVYKLPLPSSLGLEGAGIVEAVGSGVSDIKPGDRVAYCGGPPGAYSEVRVMPADRLVKLPAAVAEASAATAMLKGLTALFLLRETYPLKGGETILFHAAAGGVGLVACQLARALGITMIGTVGSEEKAAVARANGCTHTIVYTRENFVERVKELTAGKGVPVVYDSIGKDTFPGSLDCLRTRGMMVCFGSASGTIPPLDVALLAQKGSLYLTRPTLFTYAAGRDDLLRLAGELFAYMEAGKVVTEPRQTFALKDAALAHRALESRSTIGATVLVP